MLLRMAWSAVLSRSVSDAAPSHGEVRLPALDQRRMRLILLRRGLQDRNELGSAAMARLACRLQAFLERSGVPREPEPLPAYDLSSGSPMEFHGEFVRPQRPVVIRGFHARAMRWSVEWLVQRHGDQRVSLTDSEGATFEGRIRDLEAVAPNGGPFYMRINNGFFVEQPELLADLNLDAWSPWVRRESPRAASLFASVMPGTGTLLHCGGNLNTFMLLEGRKRWTLVDPSYFLLVYPYLSHTNNFQLSLITDAERTALWPLFRFCPRYTVDLEAGDCLLVPTWWYHSTRNLVPRTLAVAVRWQPYQNGEACTNRLYQFLCAVANRVEPGVKGGHQDSAELIGTGAAQATWGLDARKTSA